MKNKHKICIDEQIKWKERRKMKKTKIELPKTPTARIPQAIN